MYCSFWRQLVTAVFLFLLHTSAYSQDTLAYWAFDEASTATIATDQVGPYDGSLSGGTSFHPSGGYHAGALALDGTDGRVSLPVIDVSGHSMAITAWVYVQGVNASNDSNEGRIISKATGVAPADHVWMLGLNDGSRLRFRLRVAGQVKELQSSLGTIPVGEWRHVIASYDGAAMRLYVNGTEVGQLSVTGAISVEPSIDVAIGNQPVGSGERPFHGLIDELRVLNRAITAADLNELQNETSNRNLWVAHWQLDEPSGTVAVDTVSGYNGTLASGATFAAGGGYHGGAVQFNGSTGRISIPPFDVNGEELTLSAWIYPDNIGSQNANNEGRIISKATSTLPDDHYFMLSLNDGGRLRARLRTTASGNTRTVESEAGTIVANRWQHVAVTYDGGAVRLYLDGELLITESLTGALTAAPDVAVAIGNQPTGAGSRPFAGRIDDVRVYRQGLSQAELQRQLSAGGAAMPVQWSTTTAVATPSGSVRLDWMVADQLDNRGFWVERQVGPDGRFDRLGFVAAQRTGAYTYTDRAVPRGQLYYRLRQVDFDGAESVSPLLAARVTGYDDLRVFPNPATTAVRVEAVGPYRIYATDGRLLRSGELPDRGQPLSVATLPVGRLYVLQTPGGTVRFRK